jgi:hypothetical protein
MGHLWFDEDRPESTPLTGQKPVGDCTGQVQTGAGPMVFLNDALPMGMGGPIAPISD